MEARGKSERGDRGQKKKKRRKKRWGETFFFPFSGLSGLNLLFPHPSE